MKANLTLLVLSILVSISIFSCTEKKETPKEATAEELLQMNRDFVKALNAKDAVAAANCYTEDATLHPPNEAPVWACDNGPEEILLSKSGDYKSIMWTIVKDYQDYSALASPIFIKQDLQNFYNTFNEKKGD